MALVRTWTVTAGLAMLVLVVGVLASTPSAAHAAGADGAVEVPYLGTTDIRAGNGWAIQCDQLESLPGIELRCEPEQVTLTAVAFDPEWGEHVLAVEQRFGDQRIQTDYRIRMAPPEPATVRNDRFDIPIIAGQQALIPLSALSIECALCTGAGGASVRIGTLPPGVFAGVSDTHIAVRGTRAGPVEIPLRITDDAGQQTDVSYAITVISAPPAAQIAWHVVAPTANADVAAVVFDSRAAATCVPSETIGFACVDGQLRDDDGASRGQALIRVVDGAGTLTWGSVTFGDFTAAAQPAVPVWQHEAPLSLVFAPPGEMLESPEDATPLGTLMDIFTKVPKT